LTGATGAHNETYTYDKEGNRTLTGYVTSIGNRLTSDGTYSYTYDSDGNLLTQRRISDSQLTSYTWDFRNRLTEVLIKTSGGTTVQDDKFTYDVENRRIGKNTLSGGQTWTSYVGGNAYADFNNSGSLTFRYLFGPGLDFLIGRLDSSGNVMWYLTDKLGCVRENTDGNGNVLDSITYDTYGNILAETHPTSGDRFKYTSREWDSEIAQYFSRARYYVPAMGRFESEDPIGFRGRDSNLFRYVKNAPSIRTDPTGLVFLADIGPSGRTGPPRPWYAPGSVSLAADDFVFGTINHLIPADITGPINNGSWGGAGAGAIGGAIVAGLLCTPLGPGLVVCATFGAEIGAMVGSVRGQAGGNSFVAGGIIGGIPGTLYGGTWGPGVGSLAVRGAGALAAPEGGPPAPGVGDGPTILPFPEQPPPGLVQIGPGTYMEIIEVDIPELPGGPLGPRPGPGFPGHPLQP
jgi:RHS repeat-associated protein